MVAGHLTSVGQVQAKFSALWFLLLASFIFVSCYFSYLPFRAEKSSRRRFRPKMRDSELNIQLYFYCCRLFLPELQRR